MNGKRSQAGSAAMEFALVLPIFIAIFYGLATFGALLYTQLALSRAASDGARAVAFLPSVPAGQTQSYTPVINEVINSLAASIVAPSASNASYASRKTWLQTAVQPTVTVTPNISCGGTAAAGYMRVQVVYPYSDSAGTRMLPALNLPIVGNFAVWMPSQLSGCATVSL